MLMDNARSDILIKNLGKVIFTMDGRFVPVLAPYFRVLHAGSYGELLHLLRSDEPDVVILDLTAPDMGGLELLRTLNTPHGDADTPVFIANESDDPSVNAQALDLGALELISPLCASSVLLRRVDKLLDHRAALAASRSGDRFDPLTGLLNQRSFTVEARHLIMSNAPGSFMICVLDVDNFKIINDRFGHSEGDRLLKFIARISSEGFSGMDCLLCRDTADVFIALVPNDSSVFDHKTPGFLRRLREYDLPYSVNVHFGKYIVEEIHTDVNLMIDRAMLALRSVKGSVDRISSVFSEEMRRGLLRQQELTDDMRPALDCGQFVVYYQPQINYSTGEMLGAEALVRWQHPERGLISPAEFIPLFESNGFITVMDMYVWEQVCIFQRRAIDAGLSPVPLSVNVSRRDIRVLDLPSVLSALTAKYDIDPKLLHLEITESAYTDQPQELISSITALQKLGFFVEMDDFGAGYSSLNTLKDVPVDILKLDMQFVNDSTANSRGGTILSSIVRMANWLKLPVIAEGVETLRQADYLKSIGCLFMQGYLFAKPMPAQDFWEYLLSSVTVADHHEPVGTDIKGAADFLDASTQATLLFNSFVGGAAIVEFDGEHLEFLRANDRFFEVVGHSQADFISRISDLFQLFDAPSRELCLRELETAIYSGDEGHCELSCICWSDSSESFWLDARLRFLAQNVRTFLFYVSVENITERKELEVTRANLDNIVKNVPEGIVILQLGETAKPIFFSEKVYTLFGLEDNGSLPDKDFVAPFFPSIGVEEREADKNLLLSGASLDKTVKARRTDGSWFWLRCVASLVKRDNLPSLIYATLFDATAQRSMDEDLRSIVTLMPGGVFKSDLDAGDRVSYISDNLLAMLRCTKSEFFSLYSGVFFNAIHSEDRAEVRKALAACFVPEDTDFSCECRIIPKEGKSKLVLIIGHSTHEVDGHIGMYTVVIDRDDHVRLTNELACKSSQIHALMSNSPGGSEVFRIENGFPVREYLNEGVARLYGCPYCDLDAYLGSDPYGHVHPDDVQRVDEAARVAYSCGGTFSEEYRIKRTDGHYIWVSLTGNPVRGTDGVLRYYCSFTDISQRIATEEKLRYENERLRMIIEANKIAVFDYDYDNDVLQLQTHYQGKGYINRSITKYCERLDKDSRLASGSDEIIRSLIHNATLSSAAGSVDISVNIWGTGYRSARCQYAGVADRFGQVTHLVGLVSEIHEASEPRGEKGKAEAEPLSQDDALAQMTVELEALRESDRIKQILARHSQKYIVIYDYATDTFRPFDEAENALSNVLPLYPSPRDYLIYGIIAPESLVEVRKCYAALKSGQAELTMKFKAKGADGSWRWLHAMISSVRGKDGKPAYAIASFDDITDSYEKELAYHRYKNFMLSELSDKMFFLDYNLTRNTLENFSGNSAEFFPMTSAVKGFSVFIKDFAAGSIYPPDVSDFLRFFDRGRLERAFANGTRDGELEFQILRGEAHLPIYVRGSYQMIKEPYTSDKRLMFSCEIIDEEKRAKLALIDRAENDAVTRILNRATFFERMDAELASGCIGGIYAFAMLDLDHFKSVNDTLGHLEGDSVLFDVAHTIQSVTFREDLVGRLGGDEFGIFFGGFPDRSALADKLRIIISSIYRHISDDVKISASIGVACYPDDGENREALYKAADIALYEAKAKGRNQYIFYASSMGSGADTYERSLP